MLEMPACCPSEVTLAPGLILLLLIGFVTAYGTARIRRRLGAAMSGRTWLVIMAAVVVLGLLLWASSARP
jgi:predicted PurR-regulated permease PerM